MEMDRPFGISEGNRELLLDLEKEQSKLSRRFQRTVSFAEENILRRIEDSDELMLVVPLANYLSGRERLIPQVKRIITRFLKARDINQLKKLDELCRYTSDYQGSYCWEEVTPDIVKDYSNYTHILGLFSFNGNGWVRQAAVEQLKKIDDEDAIPYLLLRVNDWVDPIQRLASSAIRSKISHRYIDIFISHLKLIDGFSKKSRVNLLPLRDAIAKAIIDREDKLDDTLSTGDFRLRRSIYRLIWSSPSLGKESYVKNALKDTDPFIRLQAAKYLLGHNDKGLINQFLQQLTIDKWYALRLIALKVAIDNDNPKTEDILIKLVVDRSRTVRETARYYLLKRKFVSDKSEFVPLYVEAINSGDIVSGLLGLAEYGSSVDIIYAQPYLDDERPKVACCALIAYTTLSEECCLDLLLDALVSDIPSRSKISLFLLGDTHAKSTFSRVVRYLGDTGLALHVRKNSFRLLMNQSKWSKLITILETLGSNHSILIECAMEELRRWKQNYNKSFIEISDSDRQRLLKLLESVDINDGDKKLLLHLIQSVS